MAAGTKATYAGEVVRRESGVGKSSGKPYFRVEIATWGETISPEMDADQFSAFPPIGTWVVGQSIVTSEYNGAKHRHLGVKATTQEEVLRALFAQQAAPKAA